jgi:hypothetical protein
LPEGKQKISEHAGCLEGELDKEDFYLSKSPFPSLYYSSVHDPVERKVIFD